jgi:hypothetical protein
MCRRTRSWDGGDWTRFVCEGHDQGPSRKEGMGVVWKARRGTPWRCFLNFECIGRQCVEPGKGLHRDVLSHLPSPTSQALGSEAWVGRVST